VGPDAILLDVMMPKMSGYETAWKIREKFTCEELPIIFLTAKYHPRDLVDGFYSGGNDYITKPFSKEELLTRVDFQIALKEAIRESREMAVFEHELDIARRIQCPVDLEAIPRSPLFDIAVVQLPSERIGGDYCDFHLSGDGTLTAFVADVSGHGIPAAFITTMVKILFDLRKNEAPGPVEFMEYMNASLAGKIEGYFVTAEIVSIDAGRGGLQLARAGHVPMIVHRRKNDRIERHLPHGKAMGLEKKCGCEPAVVDIASGDRIIFYTDGVTDVREMGGTGRTASETGALFGDERFESFIRENGDSTASDMTDALVKRLESWNGGNRSFIDDVTVIVVDVR